MQAFIFKRYGSPDNLELQDVKQPEPGPGEVLVKVRATSINDWDWCMVRGSPFYIRLLCGLRKPKIAIPGVDVAGVVAAVGEDVVRFNVGDAVYGDLSETGFGAFAEYVCAPATVLSPMPSAMSFAEAAALPHAALLALQSFRAFGIVGSGTRILINGGGGGMGTLAAQIARAIGATDITGVDHGSKFELMKSVGMREVIDYTQDDFTRSVARYDLIVDAKTNRGIGDYLRVLAPGGAYITVGGETARLLQTALFAPAVKRFSSKRASVLALKPNKGMDEINRLYEAGALQPVIDGPYEFRELPAALARFGAGTHLGKVVVTVSR